MNEKETTTRAEKTDLYSFAFIYCLPIMLIMGITTWFIISKEFKNLDFTPPPQSQLIYETGRVVLDNTPCYGKCVNYTHFYIVSNNQLHAYSCPNARFPKDCIPNLNSLDNKSVNFAWYSGDSAYRKIYALNVEGQALMTYESSLTTIDNYQKQLKTRFTFLITIIFLSILFLFWNLRKGFSLNNKVEKNP